MARVIRVTWTDTGRTEPVEVARILGLQRGAHGGTNVMIQSAARDVGGMLFDEAPSADESFEELCRRIAAEDEKETEKVNQQREEAERDRKDFAEREREILEQAQREHEKREQVHEREIREVERRRKDKE